VATVQSLYSKDLILKSDAKTQVEVFNEVGSFLLDKGLVNDEFIDAIIDREHNYPTGLDLSPVAEGLPNVAIPHTETEFCKTKAVVFVKLTHEVLFYNMIAPEQELKVNYLFFIINNEKTNQTNVLSNLMAFMTNAKNMETLEQKETPEEIYEFLINN